MMWKMCPKAVLGIMRTVGSSQPSSKKIVSIWARMLFRMCLVRLSVESFDGRVVRKEIVKHMWEDVDSRSQKLGQAAMAMRKKQIKELADQFRANIFAYDEGFLLDDKVLAAAIWRNFFGRQCNDPRKVELLVHYIRKQVRSQKLIRISMAERSKYKPFAVSSKNSLKRFLNKNYVSRFFAGVRG